jgi:uncharacterized protein YdhG (YjbR/CyaY superfamily)
MNDKQAFQNVDEYIAQFPESTQDLLKQIRTWIKETAPEAEEYIGYGMPAYKWRGALVYFAGYKQHIGFYPTGSGITAFEHKLTNYKTSKGAIQFKLTEPLPEALIKEIVKYRIEQNGEKPYKKGN